MRSIRPYHGASLAIVAAILVASGLPATRVRASQASNGLEAVDAFVAKALAEWKVPGLAVGAVKDGRVVMARGYGYRDVARKLPVTGRNADGDRLELEVVHRDADGHAVRRRHARLERAPSNLPP